MFQLRHRPQVINLKFPIFGYPKAENDIIKIAGIIEIVRAGQAQKARELLVKFVADKYVLMYNI